LDEGTVTLYEVMETPFESRYNGILNTQCEAVFVKTRRRKMCYYYYITKEGRKERHVQSQNMRIFSSSPIILRVSTAVRTHEGLLPSLWFLERFIFFSFFRVLETNREGQIHCS